ncbi:MAG: PaaI family thioesterase [Gemmatimonadetes bacterium]|nr:PaaI family thioesterase [Gemmatimonadota bacterium]
MEHDHVQQTLDGSPAISSWGLTVRRIDHDEGRVSLRMPFLPHLERGKGSGQFHGGPIASLIDVAGDAAIAIYLDGWVPTINLRVDYLRPATGAYLDAHATVRRRGRTIGVVDIDVLDDEDRLCAVGRGTYSTIVG